MRARILACALVCTFGCDEDTSSPTSPNEPSTGAQRPDAGTSSERADASVDAAVDAGSSDAPEPDASADAAGPNDAAPEDASAEDASAESNRITFWQNVLPIFEQHCTSCHAPSKEAPFALDTYMAAFPFGEAAVEAASSGDMPPCAEVDPACELTVMELTTLRRWVAQGRAEGDAP